VRHSSNSSIFGLYRTASANIKKFLGLRCSHDLKTVHILLINLLPNNTIKSHTIITMSPAPNK
jgi:hypothetical protein